MSIKRNTVLPKQPSRKRGPIEPEHRVDVTRLEYLALSEDVARNAEAIRRLEAAHQIQFTRTAELQMELDALKKAK